MSSPENTPRTSSRERLLAAADALFYAEGIASTGVEALVARSGTARGSLYSHFGGKDGLVLAYLQAREDRWRAAWEAELDLLDAPADRVLAIFDAQARWQESSLSDHGCAHAAAIAQLPDGSPGREAARAYKRATRDRLRQLVADLVVSRSPRRPREQTSAHAQSLTDDLLLLYEGALVGLSVGAEPDPVGRARRLAADVLRRLPHPTLLHVALASQWADAQRTGVYPWSTRGATYAEIGFVHCAEPDQVAGVLERFYSDVEEPLVLLELDPGRMEAAGIEVRWEAVPGGQVFPHLYAPLDPAWVTRTSAPAATPPD